MKPVDKPSEALHHSRCRFRSNRCPYQAGAITEGREMGRDFSLYVADHWNILDLLGLGLVTGGLVVRCADGDNPWGRALYALSAPLVFSRLLFFAQMLRFHGPMIQVRCRNRQHRGPSVAV